MKNKLLFTFALGTCLFGSALSAQSVVTTQQSNMNQEAMNNVKDLANQFARNFPGPYSKNEEQMDAIGDSKVPKLLSGNEILNNNPKTAAFAERNRSAAVIFAKIGDEYIVVSADRSFKRGDKLDRNSPAFQNLSQGMGFTGKINLAGKDYLAKYDLLKDKRGNVVGAFLVATPAQ